MDRSVDEIMQGEKNSGKKAEAVGFVQPIKEENIVEVDRGVVGEVNMEEASVRADDVMRAGGFGARDDISSFLPVASDSTDFEASLLGARQYEDPQEKICRPGLGWTDDDAKRNS